MKKYLNLINIGLIAFATTCLICLILWSLKIELYFNIIGGLVSVDIFFFSTVLFFGLLYLKFVLNRMKKTDDIATLLIWTLPPIFAIISIFIVIETDSLLLSGIPPTLIILLILYSIKAKIHHILYATVSYWGLSIALAFPLCMSLFFLPCLNTSYEIYKNDGITYVESNEAFLAQSWEIVYRMTSPITMVKVERNMH